MKRLNPQLRYLKATQSLIILLAVWLSQLDASSTFAQGMSQAQDLGPTATNQTVSASIVLKVKAPNLLETYVASTEEPTSPFYHQFLSLPAFVLNFGRSSADIFLLTQYLKSFGIQVTDVYADHLLVKATGTVDAFNKVFSLDVHDFARNGKRFHRPRQSPKIPFFLQDILATVVGPSDETRFRSMNTRLSNSMKSRARLQSPMLPLHGATANGVPQEYTVGDVANLYNINPLYKAHIDGRGQTIGIATLANFLPADAFTYWSLVGLNVNPNRLTQVHVDGGGGLGFDVGSSETALDVEQSGGLAPAAKVIVYDSPNTSPGFIDLFYKAASDNLVDSLSTSWGLPEIFYFQAVIGEDDTGIILAFHQALLELASQGISTFAAAGDNGAYDANDAFNDPVNNVLCVDIPASDPAITGGGGTTTPVVLTFTGTAPGTPPLVVSNEQVWGWDYLQSYLVQYLGPTWQNALNPFGGGGGVSIFWPLPAYQSHTAGIRRSEPGQSVIYQGTDLLDLPAHFAGRNVPDVSLNADPESGNLVYATAGDIGLSDGNGGTSFVAPQLNGISALISQANGGRRLGLWNPMLYRFKQLYGHSNTSPLVDITAGDNWFYRGIPGYEPGAGLGVLDVTKLAAAVAHDGHN